MDFWIIAGIVLAVIDTATIIFTACCYFKNRNVRTEREFSNGQKKKNNSDIISQK